MRGIFGTCRTLGACGSSILSNVAHLSLYPSSSTYRLKQLVNLDLRFMCFLPPRAVMRRFWAAYSTRTHPESGPKLSYAILKSLLPSTVAVRLRPSHHRRRFLPMMCRGVLLRAQTLCDYLMITCLMELMRL